MSIRHEDLVSPATRSTFRMLATNLTVRTIAEVWQSHNFAPVPDDELRYTDTSVRRTTFESYAAAVDWSDRSHVSRALRVFEDIIRSGKREGWAGSWLDEVTAKLERDGLVLDEHGRITGVWMAVPPRVTPAGSGARGLRITEVTRRRIFDLLRRQGTAWSGGLDEIAFLLRLYNLQALPSTDSRFTTAERDIVQHRYNNQDWEDDWIYDDARFALAQGPDETLLRFLAEMIHPAVRTDTTEVQQLLAAFNEALTRDGYALVQRATISGFPVYEGRRLEDAGSERRQPTQRDIQPSRPLSAVREPTAPTPGRPPVRVTAPVRELARGERKDYACDRFPIPHGGQADVFRATHKATAATVALKQLRGRPPAERQIARMRREIVVGRYLDGHPHAMPVLDADPNHRWFVMPYAETTAEHCRPELSELPGLRALLDALCSVLTSAHQAGWIHRDIKPANILRLDGRWVLADWGIARRPRGQTTDPQRTRVGVRFGTDGFAAPELAHDAHAATQAADIYSIGQLIGWAVTGDMPQINLPLIPTSGPWRTVVRAATQRDPAHRPATVQDLQQLIVQETETPPQPPLLRAEELVKSIGAGSAAAAHELVVLAAAHTDDAPLYCDLLLTLPAASLAPALLAVPGQAAEVVRAMAALLGTHRPPERGEVDAMITWLMEIAQQAAEAGELDLLEECCNGAFEWDADWDQWIPQRHIADWLLTLAGDSASSVAGVLRRHPACAAHFSHLADNLRIDHRIRAAIEVATEGQPMIQQSDGTDSVPAPRTERTP
ncbi:MULTISPECIES: serine/threonine protein kinase [unclassified Streptomyces]|uniref:AbiJ-related protein n=1 Tax=unclassified Streptomyces TaxID=2593676 RepID=UPI0033B43E24